ncbi:efflux RND transporter permease subunit [Marinobacter orientalis]|uniref:MMPL family transporter n=1 Tax=Marinobacter orientalis TaxID=1928859 RepID=A0A7Y0NL25_9GAMM|nr:efflux RND transporter permease subunit [Marinobacter orientalis]NMT62706.1 MMPL family transporter [Marinobacter orientalis]TGX51391.1 RND transporter [Marinobacter orientalis]
MIKRLSGFLIQWRVAVVALLAVVTVVLGYFALGLEVKTTFSDLQPANHPYVQINEKYKTTFGGANVVTLMVQVDKGDIFRRDILEIVQRITKDLQYIDAVNQFQITSLASKKIKNVQASTEGIESLPLMWPDLPSSDQEIEVLREAAISNPMVYGQYVSKDLSAALITVDFIDRLIDYDKVYPQIQEIINEVEVDGVEVKVVGQPILAGLIINYLPETLKIVGMIIGVIALLLLVTEGTLRGMLLPLLSGGVTGVWVMGVITLMGINLDPLAIVITFLIAARAVSHTIQLNSAFDDERRSGGLNSRDAARLALRKLFRPGLLGLATDAGAMLVVALTPIPLLQKASLIGAMWVGAMVIGTLVMVPVALSWVRADSEHRLVDLRVNTAVSAFLRLCTRLTTNRASASAVLIVAVVLLAVSGFFAKDITVGDANPGSPILWPDSEYNRSDASINSRFPGSDRMFVVIEGEEPDALKRPEVLDNIMQYQQYMENLEGVGGTQSLVDVIRPVNMVLHEGNPRFFKTGDNALVNGEFLFFALAGSDPGDIARFSDIKYQNGAVQLSFRDHQGDTIRTAIQASKDFAAANPVDGVEYRLAGGLIGVLAAANEVIFSGQIQSIALALLVLFFFCALAYRSSQAGLFFLPLVVLSNTVTFSFMSWQGISLNVNTLPVAALGIGLGVDYAFYITDRIRESFHKDGDVREAIAFALSTAGRAVIVTAATMIASVVLWYFFSSLRFQAEMGLLIALWMSVSAISALVVIPSMVYLLRPRFIFGAVRKGEDYSADSAGTGAAYAVQGRA